MSLLVEDAEVTHTTKDTARSKLDTPFVYWIPGKKIGFLRIGFKIRDYYLKYLETDDFSHIEAAIPDISLMIGWCWTKLWGVREPDTYIMDPVAYFFILKLKDKALPTDYGFPHYVRVMVRRHLIKHFYKYEQTRQGDRSIRAFTYKPFPTARDVEHKIFVDDLIECVLKHLENDTRLDLWERHVSKYIAECTLRDKPISQHVIKMKYGFDVKKDREQLRFLVDFTDVTVRNYLYWVRECIPNIYGDESPQFLHQFELADEQIDLTDEENLSEYYTEMGYLRP